MSAVMQKPPTAFACENQQCRTKFAGSHCPLCKEPRSAFLAVLKMVKTPKLPDPLPACRYAPKSLCGCAGRFDCLEVV